MISKLLKLWYFKGDGHLNRIQAWSQLAIIFYLLKFSEVITAAEFHPIHCNLLAYSSSRGFIRLVDLRQSAVCDHNARMWALAHFSISLLWYLHCLIFTMHDTISFEISFYRLQHGESSGLKSFFTEIVSSISDIKFASDGRHLLSRDYMNLKVI